MMTHLRILSGSLVLLVLAGCVQTQPPTQQIGPAPTSCNADAFRYLIGQNISVLPAMGLQGPVRVIGPTTAVTMDMRPDRLNISHDRAGTILDIGCY